MTNKSHKLAIIHPKLKLMKYFLGGIGILLYILVSVSLLATWWVNNHFETSLNADSNRNYDISIENIHIRGIWSGLELDNLRISPLKYDSMNVINASVDYALVDGINWQKLLFEKNLEMDIIELVNPVIQLEVEKRSKASPDNSKQKISGILGDVLKRGQINDFKLKNGTFKLTNKANNKDIVSIGRINLFIDDLVTDSSAQRGVIPFLTKNTILHIEDINLNTSGFQTIHIGSFYSDLKKSREVIKDVELSLNDDWKKIAAKKRIQSDIIEISIDSIVSSGLHPVDSVLTTLAYSARKVEVYHLVLNDFRDQNQLKPKYFRKPLLYGMINKLPINIMIDSLLLHSSYIAYNEVPDGRQKPGVISLEKTNAVITGLSNVPEKQEEYGSCIIDLKTMLFGGGSTQAKIIIPYDDKDIFSLNAVLKDMPFQDANKMVAPQAGIEAQGGKIHTLNFSMNTSGNISHNTLSIEYEGLKVAILDQDWHKTKKGLSWVSNLFIKGKSTSEGKKYASADYTTARNENKSVFNFIWLSSKDGFIQTLLSKTAKNMLAPKEKEDKKEARQLRREEKKEARKEKKQHE